MAKIALMESTLGSRGHKGLGKTKFSQDARSKYVQVSMSPSTSSSVEFSAFSSPSGFPQREKPQYKQKRSLCVAQAASGASYGLSQRPEATSQPSLSMDAWLQEAVVDVIRHLRDSPFLHLMFRNKEEKSIQHEVSSDIFDDPENWASVKDTIIDSKADGFILVQRLQVNDFSRRYGSEYCGVSMDDTSLDLSCPKTDVWGLVVQGREKKRHGCFILKTTRINSLAGSCTNFSLTRAKCFGPALHKQIENSWLI